MEPSLARVFRHAVFWTDIASVSDPCGDARLARALRPRGVVLAGDARSLHRQGDRWRVETGEGPVDASDVVVALGPWAPDVLEPLGIKLPLAVKRGYHRHYRARGNAGLTRPVVDSDIGYALAPMQQASVTRGAEFADREAADAGTVRPLSARPAVFPLGDRSKRSLGGLAPIFPDMRR